MKSITYLILIFLLFSCSEDRNQTAIDEDAISIEVEEVFNDYVTHVNTKGINGVETYFSKDERFYWIEDGVVQYPNRKAMVDAIESFYPTVKTVSLKAPKIEVDVLNSNTTMLYVEYVEDILLNSGYEFTLDGAMTILAAREEGTWKFLMGHSSIKKPRGEY